MFASQGKMIHKINTELILKYLKKEFRLLIISRD